MAGGGPTRFPCPCCGYLTMADPRRGSFELCPICYWEDDEVQYRDPEYEGGANSVSLRRARENFGAFGASEERFVGEVRAPFPYEMPS